MLSLPSRIKAHAVSNTIRTYIHANYLASTLQIIDSSHVIVFSLNDIITGVYVLVLVFVFDVCVDISIDMIMNA